jgi:methylenetetrahydrofolate reductase (NADPH)
MISLTTDNFFPTFAHRTEPPILLNNGSFRVDRSPSKTPMTLSSHYRDGRLGVSFELFPPKTPKGEAALFQHVDQLVQFDPSYITCTYGAGGSTRSKTLEIVEQVKSRYALPVASHLTCVGSTVDQLRDYLREARQRGIDYIVALRGDPPSGATEFEAVEGGFRYANELVEMIRDEFPHFRMAVAGYPEIHQEAPSAEEDLENLKRKVDAGADIVITQLFYRNDDFFRFRDRYEAAGIDVPLIPGILPVTNLAQIQRITSLCGALLPLSFVAALGASDDEQSQFNAGVEFATRQVQELLDAGVAGVHFYVLNKSRATSSVLRAVNLAAR